MRAAFRPLTFKRWGTAMARGRIDLSGKPRLPCLASFVPSVLRDDRTQAKARNESHEIDNYKYIYLILIHFRPLSQCHSSAGAESMCAATKDRSKAVSLSPDQVEIMRASQGEPVLAAIFDSVMPYATKAPSRA
jgi:hypothetical protein